MPLSPPYVSLYHYRLSHPIRFELEYTHTHTHTRPSPSPSPCPHPIAPSSVPLTHTSTMPFPALCTPTLIIAQPPPSRSVPGLWLAGSWLTFKMWVDADNRASSLPSPHSLLDHSRHTNSPPPPLLRRSRVENGIHDSHSLTAPALPLCL